MHLMLYKFLREAGNLNSAITRNAKFHRLAQNFPLDSAQLLYTLHKNAIAPAKPCRTRCATTINSSLLRESVTRSGPFSSLPFPRSRVNINSRLIDSTHFYKISSGRGVLLKPQNAPNTDNGLDDKNPPQRKPALSIGTA